MEAQLPMAANMFFKFCHSEKQEGRCSCMKVMHLDEPIVVFKVKVCRDRPPSLAPTIHEPGTFNHITKQWRKLIHELGLRFKDFIT